MIEELWAALKRELLAEGGQEGLIDFLEYALVWSEIEREKQEERANARSQLQ